MTESAYNPCVLYSDELVSNPTRTFACAASCLCFGYSLGRLGNLSTASLFARDGGACAAEPGLVTKKGEPPRTSLHLISHPLPPPSLLLGSTLSKMRPVMFVCSAMPKCATMCEWPFSSALEAKIRTKDREYLTFAQSIKLNGAEMKQVNKRVRNGRARNGRAWNGQG